MDVQTTDTAPLLTVARAERTYDGVLKRHDLPRDEALKRLAEIETASRGRSKLYFKYTCAGCKARCMFGIPNTLYEVGVCPECSHETAITEAGFMVVTIFAKPTPPSTITDTQHPHETSADVNSTSNS